MKQAVEDYGKQKIQLPKELKFGATKTVKQLLQQKQFSGLSSL